MVHVSMSVYFGDMHIQTGKQNKRLNCQEPHANTRKEEIVCLHVFVFVECMWRVWRQNLWNNSFELEWIGKWDNTSTNMTNECRMNNQEPAILQVFSFVHILQNINNIKIESFKKKEYSWNVQRTMRR